MSDEAARRLGQIPLFRHLGSADLHLMSSIGLERKVQPGFVLGVGAEALGALWVVLDGRVVIRSPLGPSEAVIEAPAAWGVAALVDGARPNGTATAISECHLLELPAESVLAVCDTNTRIGYQLYRGISAHVFGRLGFITGSR